MNIFNIINFNVINNFWINIKIILETLLIAMIIKVKY